MNWFMRLLGLRTRYQWRFAIPSMDFNNQRARVTITLDCPTMSMGDYWGVHLDICRKAESCGWYFLSRTGAPS